jgi:acetyltransferase-like isoleucine patch superfamily enzyme
MIKKIYLSPFGIVISFFLNLLSFLHKPFMVYGFFNSIQRKFFKKTRISSSAKMVNKSKINIYDNVWIGHYCLIDGIGGVEIEEGVHIASHSCIYTHSSQDAIRLLGKNYINFNPENRIGYIIDSVKIGKYTFIGTSSVILPGTKLGKGVIVGAGSVVKGDFPDYSIIAGNPAKIFGNTQDRDKDFLEIDIVKHNYYDSF